MAPGIRSSIALIGGGPRGVSLLERIGANLRDPGSPWRADALEIHLIDDTEIGAGRVWRTDQHRELCMNTLAHAVTLFTDESVAMSGPADPGPTLYEWCALVLDAAYRSPQTQARVASIPPAHAAAFSATAVRAGLAEDYRHELGQQRPESHPSRALYGEYIRWCLAHAAQALPAGVRLLPHLDRVIGVREADRRQVLELAAGGTLTVDAVVAATGWMPRARTTEEETFAAARTGSDTLVWVRADSPVDQDLDRIAPGAPVIVRGLGMGFFDTMALLTLGRGGRFAEDPAVRGRLRYVPSGREPVLHATSHRGVPFRAKSLYGALPPRAPQRHLRAVDWDTAPRPIDFDADLWPRILKDAFAAYYETLARVRPAALAQPLPHLLAAIDAAPGDIDALASAVAPFVPQAADRFDLAAAISPVRGTFASPAEFDAWIAAYVADDLAEAERGADSPLKAGLWSLSSARGPASVIGSFGGFDADSRQRGFRLLHSAGGMFGSGPPAFRSRQLLALIEAGIVRFIGPGAAVHVRDGAFVARSAAVHGSEVSASALIDAWMHFHDVSASADPLAHSLVAAGRARPFRVAGRSGRDEDAVVTGGFDIDRATGLLIGADGTLDEAFHVAGIPIDEVMHDAIISPMPGTNPTMLRETDRVARSALRVAAASSRTSEGVLHA